MLSTYEVFLCTVQLGFWPGLNSEINFARCWVKSRTTHYYVWGGFLLSVKMANIILFNEWIMMVFNVSVFQFNVFFFLLIWFWCMKLTDILYHAAIKWPYILCVMRKRRIKLPAIHHCTVILNAREIQTTVAFLFNYTWCIMINDQ